MDSPSPSEVQSWLEWAGQRVLSLSVSGVWPSTYRSFWPDYPDDKFTAYGYTNERMSYPSPSSTDIELMDEILNLVILVPELVRRRILNARALIHPLNGRHINSWTKIAILIHTNDWQVRHHHKKGLETIARKVAGSSKIEYIRARLDTGPSLFP